MYEEEEILQQYLKELENGVPLSDLLSRLPKEDEEIKLSLQLVASIRTLPHPGPLLASLNTTRQRVLQQAQQTGSLKSQRDPFPSRRPLKWPFSFSPAMAVAVVALVVVFLTASVFGVGKLLSSPGNARAATLMDVNGLVEVASSESTEDWQAVNSGDQVSSGERIRTYAASSATLVFYEGTRSTLGANTDVTLTQVNGSQDGALNVRLSQDSGNIASSVVALKKNGSFIIQTPSGNASVKGTHFNVAVDSQLSRFSVTSGKVLVSNLQSQVSLAAGQATAILDGEKPDSPAYQFSVQGTITEIDGNTWVVDGVTFQVIQETVIKGNPQTGSLVIVQGRILENGAWVADLIDFAETDQMISSFTGIITAMDGNIWQISGVTVHVDESTQRSPNLVTGDAVQVTFTTRADNTRLANKIELLQAEPNPVAEPELEFSPDEIEQSDCSTDYNLTGSLTNQATDPVDVAQGVDLGSLVERGSQYIQNVEIQPFAWDTIKPGETVSTVVHISLNQAWTSSPNGTEVKVVIFVAHEANRPDHLNARLVLTLHNTCQQPSVTEPMTDTIPAPITPPTNTLPLPSPQPPTTTITSTLTITDCVGATLQPKAVKLADEYRVSYSVIMGWFCQGYGFGEIELAYSLTFESKKPVSEVIDVFKLRSSGLGWGEIKQQLDEEMKKLPPGQEKNTPGDNKDKTKSNNSNNEPPGKSNNQKP